MAADRTVETRTEDEARGQRSQTTDGQIMEILRGDHPSPPVLTTQYKHLTLGIVPNTTSLVQINFVNKSDFVISDIEYEISLPFSVSIVAGLLTIQK